MDSTYDFSKTIFLLPNHQNCGTSNEEETDVDDEIIKTELKWIEPDSHGREQKRMKKDPEPIEAHTLEHSPLFSHDEFHNLDQLFSFEDALQF